MPTRDQYPELWRAAAPICDDCGEPFSRCEQRWVRDDDGNWHLGTMTLVCTGGHRKVVDDD